MFLLPVATLRNTLSFDDMVKTNAACAAALNAATEALINELRTPLAQEQTIDKFYVRPGAGLRFGSGGAEVWRARLALSCGFVTGSPAIAYASNLTTLSDSPEELLPNNYIFDMQKGELIIEGIDLRGKYVQVTYWHGFAPDGDDGALFDQAYVPEWLRQAALSYAIMVLRERNPDLVGDDAAKAKNSKEEALAAVARYVRYFPNPIRPL